MVYIRCSGCGKRLHVPDDSDGRRCGCPACGNEFRVSLTDSATRGCASGDRGMDTHGLPARILVRRVDTDGPRKRVSVSLNDKPLARLKRDQAIRKAVLSGKHVLTLACRGHPDVAKLVECRPGETIVFTVELTGHGIRVQQESANVS